MVYRTIERLTYIGDYHEVCIQQCKCANEEYIEKDGRCIKQKRKENQMEVTFCYLLMLKFAKLPPIIPLLENLGLGGIK